MFNKLVLCSFFFISFYASSQVGINTDSPDGASILDVAATDKGILIPRVDIEDLQTIDPVTGGTTESLLVYNTNPDTGEGFYFWKNNRWNMLFSSDSVDRGLQFSLYMITPQSSPDLIHIRNNVLSSGSAPWVLPLQFGPLAMNGWVVKFTGTYTVKNAGTFHFTSQTDDGARIYVDGSLILNRWVDGALPNTGTGSVNLAKGKHTFEFWYYDNAGNGQFTFSWGANPDGNTGVIQATQFTVEY